MVPLVPAAAAAPEARSREQIAAERRSMFRRLGHYMRLNRRLYALGIATTLVYALLVRRLPVRDGPRHQRGGRLREARAGGCGGARRRRAEDAIDLDRLRHDPLMKVAVGRCPETGAALASQSTISRLENAPSKSEADPRKRAEIRTELASSYYREGRLAIALEEAQRAVQVDSRYAPALGLLGLIYMEIGDRSEAEASFGRALRLDPENGDMLNNYGWYLCQSGRERESVEYFQRAASNRLYATPSLAMRNAGGCLLKINDLDGAERALRRALEFDGTDAVTKYELARLHLRRNQPDRAAFYYGSARSCEPKRRAGPMARAAHRARQRRPAAGAGSGQPVERAVYRFGGRSELLRNLKGRGSVEVVDGHMQRFALVGNILSLLNIADVAETVRGEATGFRFTRIGGTGHIRDGGFVLEEGVFDSPSARMAANGTIRLGDGESKITVLVAPLGRVDRVVRGIPIFGYVIGGTLTSIPVGVSGDIRDPLVVPLGPRAVTEELRGVFQRALRFDRTALVERLLGQEHVRLDERRVDFSVPRGKNCAHLGMVK